jgi:hypothetical protein
MYNVTSVKSYVNHRYCPLLAGKALTLTAVAKYNATENNTGAVYAGEGNFTLRSVLKTYVYVPALQGNEIRQMSVSQ